MAGYGDSEAIPQGPDLTKELVRLIGLLDGRGTSLETRATAVEGRATALEALVTSVAANATVVDHAEGATLAAGDMGKIHTNTGAADAITLVLPAAAGVSKKFFRVAVTAAQIVNIDPNGTEKIYLNGSGAAGKYLGLAGVIGNFIDLYCDGTDWFVMNYSGVATKEA